MAFGRPTEYDPAFCQLVIDMGKDGLSVTQMACELGVHRDSLYEWEKVHADFSDAFTRARQWSQAWWEKAGQTGMFTQGFNAAVWSKNVSCRFPADYTDKSKQEITGRDGAPLFGRIEIVAVEPAKE